MNLINSDHPLLLAESDPWREDKWGKGVLEGMADEAFQLMKENNGVGLALNQIGVDCSCFIMDGDFFLPRLGVKKVDGEYRLNMGQMLLLSDNLRKVNGEYYMLFVNPWFKDQHRGISRKAEGCLSLGEKYKVARAKSIRAGWTSIGKLRDGTPFNTPCDMTMSGDLARCFQHEYDHTQGILISNKGKVIK
jgi:peptide deformylase